MLATRVLHTTMKITCQNKLHSDKNYNKFFQKKIKETKFVAKRRG